MDKKELDSKRLEVLIDLFVDYRWRDIPFLELDKCRPADEKYISKESLLKFLDKKIESE